MENPSNEIISSLNIISQTTFNILKHVHGIMLENKIQVIYILILYMHKYTEKRTKESKIESVLHKQ